MAGDATAQEATGRLMLAAAGASGTWDWDIVARRLFVDDRFAALYGLTPSDEGLPVSAFFAAVHPDDQARLRIAVAGILGGAQQFSKEFRVVRADGSIVWLHGRGVGHVDADDQPVHFTGLLVDVTERRLAEDRLRIAQTAGGVGTFEYTDGYATVAVSEQFCRLLGLHPTTVLPVRTINGTLVDGQPAIIPEAITVTTDLAGEFAIVRPDDGERRWVARRGEIVRDSEGPGFKIMGVLYDVTAAKRSEAQLRELNETLEARVEQEIAVRLQAEDTLRQAQKMEAVGQLTGGIAHDFNNLLTVIRSSVDLLRRPDVDEKRRARYIEAISDTADRAAKLTRQLLAFARRQALKPEVFNVVSCVNGIAEMLRTVIGARVELAIEVHCDHCYAEADIGQFETALVNMAVNARDAMDGEGRLTIAVSDGRHVASPTSALAAGDFIAVSVGDTGTGIDDAVLPRLFEPFFTTKDVGKGTGLGLSQVYGFAKQSGGEVEVESRSGVGSTFTLYLPRTAMGPEAAEAREAVVPAKAQGRVLVVEDNEQVNEFAADLLSDLGYDTVSTANAAEALATLERMAGAFDILFSDVVMPGMGGVDLARQVRERWPAIRILLTSGYSHVLATEAGHGFALLQKPYSVEELSTALRDARASGT